MARHNSAGRGRHLGNELSTSRLIKQSAAQETRQTAQAPPSTQKSISGMVEYSLARPVLLSTRSTEMLTKIWENLLGIVGYDLDQVEPYGFESLEARLLRPNTASFLLKKTLDVRGNKQKAIEDLDASLPESAHKKIVSNMRSIKLVKLPQRPSDTPKYPVHMESNAPDLCHTHAEFLKTLLARGVSHPELSLGLPNVNLGSVKATLEQRQAATQYLMALPLENMGVQFGPVQLTEVFTQDAASVTTVIYDAAEYRGELS